MSEFPLCLSFLSRDFCLCGPLEVSWNASYRWRKIIHSSGLIKLFLFEILHCLKIYSFKDHLCFSFNDVKSGKVVVLTSSSSAIDWSPRLSHISISSRILATVRPKCVEMIFWSMIMMAEGNALISKASAASPQSSMSALMKRISFLMPFWLTVDLFP